MPTLQVAGRVPLAGFYALYFGTTGIVLPFLPAYLRGLDLTWPVGDFNVEIEKARVAGS